MRVLFLLTALFLPIGTLASEEKPLHDLEAHCWASAVEGGSFLCQHLMLMGKVEGREGWQIPELYAPEGEEKQRLQADLACARLGFRYARGFELGHAEKDTLMARLEESSAWIFERKGAFIRHLLCD